MGLVIIMIKSVTGDCIRCSLFLLSVKLKGELNHKTDFPLFEHLGTVEQLHEVFLSCKSSSSKNFMFCNKSTRFDRRLNEMSAVVYDKEKHGYCAAFGCY